MAFLRSQTCQDCLSFRVLAPHDRPLIVADMNLQNPVVINRRRISQENGIEARESVGFLKLFS